ncbi:hypothetical protein K501DRAFT_330002 [Backusella circina FSU 941]|nr:hypothetical protein K501DRAFT_330002 [Backusella circina FSU 941]
MDSYLGFKELQEYIASNHEPEFDQFIEENKNNIVIWSSSTNSNSVEDLFSMWKSRYQKMWNSDSKKEKTRCPKIVINNILYKWESIEKMIQEIKLTKYEYAIQAFTILRSMSSLSTKLLLQLMQQEASSSEQSTTSPEPNNNDIVLPSTNNRYNINQFDVSLAFYTFQLIASNNFDTINIESNVSHILIANTSSSQGFVIVVFDGYSHTSYDYSSIFLIQREKWHPDLIGVFTEEKLKDIFDDQCKRFNIRKYIRTCINNTDTITSLIKNVKNDIITREEGIVQAYKLGFTPSPLSITATIIAPLISTNINVTTLTTPTSSTLPEQQSSNHQQAPAYPLSRLPRNVNKLLKCVAGLRPVSFPRDCSSYRHS